MIPIHYTSPPLLIIPANVLNLVFQLLQMHAGDVENFHFIWRIDIRTANS